MLFDADTRAFTALGGILRCVIREIMARIADARIELVIHWQGGDHTKLSVVKNRTGQHRWTTAVKVQTLMATQIPPPVATSNSSILSAV